MTRLVEARTNEPVEGWTVTCHGETDEPNVAEPRHLDWTGSAHKGATIRAAREYLDGVYGPQEWEAEETHEPQE
jgi:hypothetical protein